MTVPVLAFFECLLVIKLLAGPSDDSQADDEWIAYMAVVALSILVARATVIGIWFGDGHLLVRSWFSTRRIGRDDLVGCSTAPWSSWRNRGADSSLSVVSLRWNRSGYLVTSDLESTVSSHRRARIACAVIEEFAFDGTRGSACDYARGPLFAEIDARIRHAPKRPARHL